MRKILVLAAALFLLVVVGCVGDSAQGRWAHNFGGEFRYRVTISYREIDTAFLVRGYKMVKDTNSTRLNMQDGVMWIGNMFVRGIEFSKITVVVRPDNIVHIQEISKRK